MLKGKSCDGNQQRSVRCRRAPHARLDILRDADPGGLRTGTFVAITTTLCLLPALPGRRRRRNGDDRRGIGEDVGCTVEWNVMRYCNCDVIFKKFQ